MYKVDCEGKLLVCDLKKKIMKMELADNITKRCQRYKMNKIKCFSPNTSHFNCIILKITIFLLTGLRIYTGEYKAQGPTLCPTEGRALRGPRALYSPV